MMKKTYETPVAEKVEFRYQEQVATSTCISVWMNEGVNSCTDGNSFLKPLND